LVIELESELAVLPEVLTPWALEVAANGCRLVYTYDPHKTHTGINALLQAIWQAGSVVKDVHTTKTSLEEIFVNLVTNQTAKKQS